MSSIDYTSPNGQNRLEAAVNSELRIRCGVRDQALMGCYETQSATKAKRSKSLHIGSQRMSQVTDEKGDIDVGHYNTGATYLTKEEYAKEICFSGSDLRYSERDPVGKVSERLMEADDFLMDEVLMDTLLGPMMVGDQCKPELTKDICCIEHDGLGITPEKIIAAATAIRRFCPGKEVIIPITIDMQAQLTRFDAFINQDFMLNGQSSAYSGMVMESKWYGVKFKMVADFNEENSAENTQDLIPVIPAERYEPGGAGTWDGESYVRHVPVWSKRTVDFEQMMMPSVSVFDVWKQRRKPKGTLAMRIDHEFGFAVNNPKGRAVMKIIEKNKELCI